RRHCIESLVWKHGAMHAIPAPPRHIAAEMTRQLHHRVMQGRRYGLVARLAFLGAGIIAPRTVGGAESGRQESCDVGEPALITLNDDRAEIVSHDRWRQLKKPRLEDRRGAAVGPRILIPRTHDR